MNHDLLIHTASIENRQGQATNEKGMQVETFAPSITTACRIEPKSGNKIYQVPSGGATVGTYLLYLPAETTISTHARVTIGGESYNVLDVQPISNDFTIDHIEAELQKVD